MSLIVHHITLFMIYCIIQITMILFIILNATLNFSQHLLWKCGWKTCYALIFLSAACVLLCISFWVSNSLFSGEIPTIWSVHLLMVSLSNVWCHQRTSSQKPMPTVKLSPGFVGHPFLFLYLTRALTSIVSLPKKSLLGYSTQTTCITCIYPSYLLLSLHLPPSPALEIPKMYLVTKHLLFQKLLITLFQNTVYFLLQWGMELSLVRTKCVLLLNTLNAFIAPPLLLSFVNSPFYLALISCIGLLFPKVYSGFMSLSMSWSIDCIASWIEEDSRSSPTCIWFSILL